MVGRSPWSSSSPPPPPPPSSTRTAAAKERKRESPRRRLRCSVAGEAFRGRRPPLRVRKAPFVYSGLERRPSYTRESCARARISPFTRCERPSGAGYTRGCLPETPPSPWPGPTHTGCSGSGSGRGAHAPGGATSPATAGAIYYAAGGGCGCGTGGCHGSGAPPAHPHCSSAKSHEVGGAHPAALVYFHKYYALLRTSYYEAYVLRWLQSLLHTPLHASYYYIYGLALYLTF